MGFTCICQAKKSLFVWQIIELKGICNSLTISSDCEIHPHFNRILVSKMRINCTITLYFKFDLVSMLVNVAFSISSLAIQICILFGIILMHLKITRIRMLYRCKNIWLTITVWSLVSGYFNKQSVFLWAIYVLNCLPNRFYNWIFLNF